MINHTLSLAKPSAASVILAMLCAASTALAADPSTLPADTAPFANLKSTYEQAVREDKPELLEPLLDPDFSATTFTAQEITGYPGLKDFWEKLRARLGPGATATSDLAIAPNPIIESNLAILHGSSREILSTPDRRKYFLTLRWTAVLRKSAGTWKVLRIQQSLDPIQNDLTQNSSSRLAMWAGVISLIAGLAMGVVFTRFARSKPAAP